MKMRKGNLIKLLLQKHKKAFGKCLILKQKKNNFVDIDDLSNNRP